MIYLLDTNVCISYLRGRSVSVRRRMAATPIEDIRLCSVVKAELGIGVLRSSNAAINRDLVAAFVAPYQSCSFDDASAEIHAQVRHQLETSGNPIGPYDLQIAAIALANGYSGHT